MFEMSRTDQGDPGFSSGYGLSLAGSLVRFQACSRLQSVQYMLVDALTSSYYDHRQVGHPRQASVPRPY